MGKYTALEQAGIPTKIELTDSFVSSMMKIAECKPFFSEVLTAPLRVQLLRQAKVRAITYSNQIEGNQLDERAVTHLIKTRANRARDKDAQEILNYQNALSYAETLAADARFPSPIDFCDLQNS